MLVVTGPLDQLFMLLADPLGLPRASVHQQQRSLKVWAGPEVRPPIPQRLFDGHQKETVSEKALPRNCGPLGCAVWPRMSTSYAYRGQCGRTHARMSVGPRGHARKTGEPVQRVGTW